MWHSGADPRHYMKSGSGFKPVECAPGRADRGAFEEVDRALRDGR
jgi:hypothetical protein